MDHEKIQKILGTVIKGALLFLVALVFISFSTIEITPRPKDDNPLNLPAPPSDDELRSNLPKPWPPQMNVRYPDLKLLNQKGQDFKLSDYEGRVIVVEYIDMGSPISQAQSGAKERGVFSTASNKFDKLTQSFDVMLEKNTEPSLTLPQDDIVMVKVIVFGPEGKQGSRDDAQDWAEHFGFTIENNVIVAVPEVDIRGEAMNGVIGGYQLLDKNYKLRVDSAGPDPKHNLRMTFMPMVPKLAR